MHITPSRCASGGERGFLQAEKNGLHMWAGLQPFRQHGSPEESFSLLEGASYHPLPVGGIAVALMLGTYSLLRLPPDVPLLLLAASGTTLIYLVDRASSLSPEDVYNSPGRLAWMRSHRGSLWSLAAVMSVLGLAMLPFLRPRTLVVGVLLGGVGFAYGVPILPGGRRLKALGIIKPFLVAIPWAVGAVVVPVIEAGMSISFGIVALTVYRVCWVLPNVLLAEWSDRVGDAAVGLPTARASGLPDELRGRASIWTVGGLLGALASVGWGGSPPLLLVDAAGLFLLLGGVWTLRPDRNPGHAFVADLLVAWPLVTALVGWMRV